MNIWYRFAALMLFATCGCALAHSVDLGLHRTDAQNRGERSHAASYDAGFISVGQVLIGRFMIRLFDADRNPQPPAEHQARESRSGFGGTALAAEASNAVSSFDGDHLGEVFSAAGGADAFRPNAIDFSAFNAEGAGRSQDLSLSAPLAIQSVSAVPEPSTYAAMLTGLCFIGVLALSRRKGTHGLAQPKDRAAA